jgi:tetratricopeptide (TPR) repeat protein
VFQHVLQVTSSLSKAHYFEGLAYLRWEHWPEAASQFQAELNQNPADLDAKYNLGFVYLQQAKTDEAFKAFSEVIAAEPNYANAQYQVGKMLLDRGDYDSAIGHLEIAARFAPQVDYVHYQLQAAYRKRSRIAEADRELELYKQLKAKAREQSALPKQNP